MTDKILVDARSEVAKLNDLVLGAAEAYQANPMADMPSFRTMFMQINAAIQELDRKGPPPDDISCFRHFSS